MMTKTKTIHGEIKARSVQSVPGDNLRRLTAPAKCDDGTVLPRGTEYRALCGGFDNTTMTRYCQIILA